MVPSGCWPSGRSTRRSRITPINKELELCRNFHLPSSYSSIYHWLAGGVDVRSAVVSHNRNRRPRIFRGIDWAEASAGPTPDVDRGLRSCSFSRKLKAATFSSPIAILPIVYIPRRPFSAIDLLPPCSRVLDPTLHRYDPTTPPCPPHPPQTRKCLPSDPPPTSPPKKKSKRM